MELANTHKDSKRADQTEKGNIKRELQAWTEASNEVTEKIDSENLALKQKIDEA